MGVDYKLYLPIHGIALSDQTPFTILSLTVWGEARGEFKKHGQMALDAIAHVVKNRVKLQRKSFGLTVVEVCLKPRQFSCWNPTDPNRDKLLSIKNDAIWRRCVDAALGALNGTTEDLTGGATHYLTIVTDTAWESKLTFCKRIGSHDFYK